jgi:hypothetical protein
MHYGDIQLSYSIPFLKNKSIDLLLNVNNFWDAKFENNGFTYRERYADGTGGFTDAVSPTIRIIPKQAFMRVVV